MKPYVAAPYLATVACLWLGLTGAALAQTTNSQSTTTTTTTATPALVGPDLAPMPVPVTPPQNGVLSTTVTSRSVDQFGDTKNAVKTTYGNQNGAASSKTETTIIKPRAAVVTSKRSSTTTTTNSNAN